jgi:leader peptidase (prepilin peptidase)/N-methyltransferase
MFPMVRILITAFAALVGLAFGSFLNVCLSRWPEAESIVTPRSHCRSCGRALAWWENVPLVSWIALRGRCRTCNAWIGWRYPVVEFAIGILWAISTWRYSFAVQHLSLSLWAFPWIIVCFLGPFTLLWLLVALAALDAQDLWLPDQLTLPGILGGAFVAAFYRYFFEGSIITPVTLANFFFSSLMRNFWLSRLLAILIAALLILLIRWLYKLIRKREGIGLGDAKLMAMLAAWLGLESALLSFFLGIALGSVVAVVALALPSKNTSDESWALKKLPLGTFLCIGGIVSALWGQPIIDAYLRWAGF